MRSIKYFFLVILLSLIGRFSIAQKESVHVRSVINFDSKEIKEQGIRSAHVTTEITKKHDWDFLIETPNPEPNFIISRKRMEVSFNQQGQKDYWRYILFSMEVEGYDMFRALGDENTVHNTFEFNDQNKITNYCNLEGYWENCITLTYNDQGNLTSYVSTSDRTQSSHIDFIWNDDKMIRATVHTQDSLSVNENEYDEKGRLTEYKWSEGDYVQYTYTDTDDETKVVTSMYLADTLSLRRGYVTERDSEKILSSFQLNLNGDTISSKHYSYDSFGNLQLERMYDQSSLLEFKNPNREKAIQPKGAVDGLPNYTEPVPEVKLEYYHFKNYYEKGLLTKRETTLRNSKGEVDPSSDIIIEYVRYEHEELPLKSWLLDDPYNDVGY